jgi:hypothetical protein
MPSSPFSENCKPLKPPILAWLSGGLGVKSRNTIELHYFPRAGSSNCVCRVNKDLDFIGDSINNKPFFLQDPKFFDNGIH